MVRRTKNKIIPTKKSYGSPEEIILLDKTAILKCLTPHCNAALGSLEIFDSLNSTNTYLMECTEVKSNKTQACFAEQQTAGKGRAGKQWLSPYAENIYLSLLWHFPRAPKLSGLSLATATAIIETLQLMGIRENLALKWPNDVFWKQQKLAGALIELKREPNEACSTVIGIGLNVHMKKSQEKQLDKPWTSIQEIIPQSINRNEIAGLLLNELITTLLLFQEKGFQAFLDKWRQFDIAYQRLVTILTPTTTFQGIGHGINEAGHFLLKTESGDIKSFSSGEVSLQLKD